MSYILNALRKSERERQAAESDNIAERIVIHPQSQHRSFTGLVVGLIAVNLGILIYFLGFAEKSSPTVVKTMEAAKPAEPSATQTTIPISSANQAVVLQNTANITMPKAAIPPRQVVGDKKARIDTTAKRAVEKAAESKTTVSLDVPKAKKTEPVVSVATPATIQQKVRLEPAAAKAVQQTEPDNEQALPSAESVTNTPLAVENSDVPFLDELPYEFQLSLPPMHINVFSYSEVPSERFVMIDMVKYVPGQRIKDQLEFKKILSNAIVVVYKGRTFKIRRP